MMLIIFLSKLLGYELPTLSFKIEPTPPKNDVSVYKVYDSSTLKCKIDLKLKKLKKNTKIILFSNRNIMEDSAGNKVSFIINKSNYLKNSDIEIYGIFS